MTRTITQLHGSFPQGSHYIVMKLLQIYFAILFTNIVSVISDVFFIENESLPSIRFACFIETVCVYKMKYLHINVILQAISMIMKQFGKAIRFL
jgi:hypothetical protein